MKHTYTGAGVYRIDFTCSIPDMAAGIHVGTREFDGRVEFRVIGGEPPQFNQDRPLPGPGSDPEIEIDAIYVRGFAKRASNFSYARVADYDPLFGEIQAYLFDQYVEEMFEAATDE